MSYLTKDQYERRNENAAKRMQENAEIETLTEEQHEALSELCSTRHDLHSDKRSVIVSDDGTKKELVKINEQLLELDMPTMSFIPTDQADYIDIDDIDELLTIDDDVPESGTDEYQNWYNTNYERISNELEELNKKIENYLAEIDEKFGTNYCPTGSLRIF